MTQIAFKLTYQLLPFVSVGQARAPLAIKSTLQRASAKRTALIFITGLWGRLENQSANTNNLL